MKKHSGESNLLSYLNVRKSYNNIDEAELVMALANKHDPKGYALSRAFESK